MEFSPNIFLVLQSGDQEALDNLMRAIDELHENPNFILVLISSVTPEFIQNNFIIKQILIQIRNAVRLKWKIPEFWPDDVKKVIIENLYRILFELPVNLRVFVTCIFGEIAPRYYEYTFWVEELIPLLESHSEINDIAYLIDIANYWFISCSERIDNYEPRIDEIALQIFHKSFAFFEGAINNMNTNSNCIILSSLLVQTLRYSLSFSYLIPESNVFDQIVPVLCNILTFPDSSNEIIAFKINILKLFNTCHSSLFGKQKKKNSISKDPRRLEFSMHFREFISPQIANIVKTIITVPQHTKVSTKILYTIYQLIFYSIDTDLICDNLFQLLINASQINEGILEELEVNPILFIDQEMVYGLIKTSIPRNVTSGIIEALITRHNIESSVIMQYISPDLENDSAEIIDAKLFLIGSIHSAFIQKQKEQHEKEELKSKKRNKSIGELATQQVLPNEVADICAAIIENPDAPIYLILTSLHVFSKVVRYIDPGRGCSAALEVLQTDAAQENPILAIYAAKLFNTCFKKTDGEMNVDIAPYIEVIVNAAVQIQARALFNFLSVLVEKSPEAVIPSTVNVCEALISFISNSIENEDQTDAKTTADTGLNTLIDIIETVQDNTELMTTLIETICVPVIQFICTADVTFPIQKFFLLLQYFSMNITNHEQIFYEGFLQIYNTLINNEEFAKIVLITAGPWFVWYLYPLIADANQFSRDQAFSQPVVDIAVRFYNLFVQLEENQVEFEADSLPYLLYLMATITQSYGIIAQIMQAAFQQLSKIVAIFQTENKPRSKISLKIIVGVIQILSAASQIDLSSIQIVAHDENAMQFLCMHLPHHMLTTYRESRAGIILLLNCARLGCIPAFQAATRMVDRMIKLRKRDNSEDENSESDSSDEEEDSESEDEDSTEDEDQSEDDSDSESEDSDEDEDEEEEIKEESDDDDYLIDERIICPYHLPFESLNEFELFKTALNENGSLMSVLSQEEIDLLNSFIC